MAEITLSGHAYRTGLLTPVRKFHVARRLIPVFEGLLPALKAVADRLPDTATSFLDIIDKIDFVTLLTEFRPFDAFAKMTDNEMEDILYPCLMVVSRMEGQAWVPIMPRPGELLYADLQITDMIQLTWAVIQENVIPFLTAPLAPGPASAAGPRVVASRT